MLGKVIRVAVMLLALAIALALQADDAAAQSCTSDFQCGPSANGYNVCLGDALVMRRRLCVGGQCVEQEMGRLNCGGGTGGTCQGNVFVRSGNRCDALSGRCVQGSGTAVACVKSCTCTGRTLTISTGTCSVAGCVRTVLRCKTACTCSPEPQCTEVPQPSRSKSSTEAPPTPAATAAAAAARASRITADALPPLIAEPFEAGEILRATKARPEVKATKRKKRAR